MRQDFQRRLEVPAANQRVWETLVDVRQVASWLSIVGEVQELERLRRYRAVLEDRLGPFKLRADLDIELHDVEEGHGLAARATGEDRQVGSRISVEASLRLEAADSGTALLLAGSYEVTGRVASLGAGSIRKKGETLLDDFFLNARASFS